MAIYREEFMNSKINLSEIDIVYPVRKLAEGNSELRYSLRSVAKNLPHRNIWVIGEEIEWLSSIVRRIDLGENGAAFANVNRKLMEAVENPLISDPFIFMMDDIFVMQEIREIPYYAIGRTLSERLRRYDEYGTYARDLQDAQNILWFERKEEIDFEAHAPIIFKKAGLQRILTRWPESGHRRSLYGNFFKKKPTYVDDFKIYGADEEPKKAPYISTCVESWNRNSKAYQLVTQTFAEQCDYEWLNQPIEELEVKEEE